MRFPNLQREQVPTEWMRIVVKILQHGQGNEQILEKHMNEQS